MIAQMTWKLTISQYKYATVYVNHASRAKATKWPWRGKNWHDYEEIKYTVPGEMVSVDHLISPSPGFIAQMTGKLTISRYKYATVYVNHASRLGYIYLQKSANADETVKGKISFEAFVE
jgi:hypothetical protein